MTSPTLDERILAAVSKEEIRDALFRYCRGLDRGDADLMRSAYHEDAIEHHGDFYDGPARSYCDFVVEHLDTVSVARHELTNVIIDLDGDTAKAESYFLSIQRMDGRPDDDFIMGRYLDRFAFRDGHWRITERRVVFDWTIPVTPNGESPYAPSFPVGKRDRTDPLWQL